MNTVAVVDYDMGNTDSVIRALSECGGNPILTRNARDFSEASHIVLPGVGAFDKGMRNLIGLGVNNILEEQVIEKRKPFLGICVGMQLLASSGVENSSTSGLGWIKGDVSKLLPTDQGERVPQLGWNDVYARGDPLLFSEIPQGTDFYFANSYHFNCNEEREILATTQYCGTMVSAVKKNNIYGVQFHPEKSQKYGLLLIRNFLRLTE